MAKEAEFNHKAAKFSRELALLTDHSVVIPLDLATLMVTATIMAIEQIDRLKPGDSTPAALLAMHALLGREDQFKALAEMVVEQGQECLKKAGRL
jgi:hypothetical protein